MAIERRNPLPPGRYWIDAIDIPAQPGSTLPGLAETQIDRFRAWLEKNKAAVKVEKAERFESIMVGVTIAPAREWYLFRVESPVQWEGPGLPTIAGSEIKSSRDTGTVPPPERMPTPLEAVENAARSFATTAAIGVIAFVVLHATLLGPRRAVR